MFASTPRLVPSVITSSAVMPLATLFNEVLDIHPDTSFDLLVLRPEDVESLELTRLVGDGRITELMADHFDAVADRLVGTLREYAAGRPGRAIRVAALATYFPDVSSMNNARRTAACRAVANCVRLCHRLKDTRYLGAEVTPCVEIVCGSLLERVPETHDVVAEYTQAAKVDRLVQSLKDIQADLGT
ncbi:MAG TPA: hypothetical protein VD866_29315, partial [Urbifossiella sp.]|nr:hypothetical protein [Urbifossiella sp.]